MHNDITRSVYSPSSCRVGLSQFAAAFVRPHAEEHRSAHTRELSAITAALRCVSKHGAAARGRPHPSRRPHAKCVRAPQGEGGTEVVAVPTHELVAALIRTDR